MPALDLYVVVGAPHEEREDPSAWVHLTPPVTLRYARQFRTRCVDRGPRQLAYAIYNSETARFYGPWVRGVLTVEESEAVLAVFHPKAERPG